MTETAYEPGAALRRRRLAAYRTPPLPEGSRDPLDELVQPPGGPSTYGLTEAELRAHANALMADGWSLEEVQARLDVAPRDACCPRHGEASDLERIPRK
ncbi:hypothetical protein HLK59_29285 [Streptomyces sp. S3(2020)]|uniref:hypothetical protein n=1 Tax=Streptomyces sp. S3(2020) TaxID=2732044 RepID=UPI0014899ABF|nr:hypothetical protein [Streptomyces sp. S3(2020)]NNN34385.1 hypothetical protein [Streptomyces sp. S3(2020)]